MSKSYPRLPYKFSQGLVGFSATALCTLTLLGSFGPCVALANLRATLQQTLAAGNRVLDILDETPQVEKVSGQPIVHFDGAEASGVTFDHGDESVGELGDSLSGGERQRLGLARAFLHDAPLLLLDEPTSNLDSLNEAVILQSLHRQRGRRTVVLVSHRASAAAIADDIVTLDQGRAS